MFFWNSCFSDDPMDVGIGPLVPLPFLNPSWTSGISLFTYCWSLAWRILGITLLVCEISATLWVFEHSLAFPFFVIGMQTALFQPCGHCWVFQICIWNSSTGNQTTNLIFHSFSRSGPKRRLVETLRSQEEACSRGLRILSPLYRQKSLGPLCEVWRVRSSFI